VNQPAAKAARATAWDHISVALAAGICIVALAYVSKRVLADPLRPVFLALPPLLLSWYELVARKQHGRLVSKSVVWVVAILVVTGLIILFHL